MSQVHRQTRAVHVSAPPLNGSRPVSVPIYQTSTFAFDDPDLLAEGLRQPDASFAYSRYANPTVRALENAVADLEDGQAAIACASGMGAINSILLALLRPGDHVIAQTCLYGGTYATFHDLQERFGVDVTYVSGEDPDEVRQALRPETKVLYLETIANPMVQVCDLPAMFAVSREAGITGVVDNTFASPELCRPIEHGADIVIHSATKYLGGHSDVILGIAVFAEEERYREVWQHAIELGANADPFAAWLTIRGLQTLPLRMRQHCINAEHLAVRLVDHPAVHAVHWPGLPSHPSHELACRLLSGHGGVLSFEVKGDRERAREFSCRLRLAHRAASLGGVETLILHPASTTHRKLDEAALEAAGIYATTIRVAVGIEHPDDIWNDFDQALNGI